MHSTVWTKPPWMEADQNFPVAELDGDGRKKRVTWQFFGVFRKLKAAMPRRFQMMWSTDFYVVDVRITKPENLGDDALGTMLIIAEPSN
jgi:hypothetical protein